MTLRLTYYWIIKFSHGNAVTYLASKTEPVVTKDENGMVIDIQFTPFKYPVFGSNMVTTVDWRTATNISIEVKRPTESQIKLYAEITANAKEKA
jgi:hypothetical protein